MDAEAVGPGRAALLWRLGGGWEDGYWKSLHPM